MRGQKLGYVRVSSVTQNTERQLDGLEVDRIFEDRLSGKDTNRPALQELLAYCREGDTVHVHSLDRLGRNLDDLRQLVQLFRPKFHTRNCSIPAWPLTNRSNLYAICSHANNIYVLTYKHIVW